MTDLNQVRVQWTGLKGMPGVSTFYSVGDASFLLGKLKTFYEALKAFIPTGTVLTYPSTGVVVDSSSGAAISSWAATAPAVTTCTGPGTFAAPAGVVINWKTGLYVGGRELRGKTFIVPVTGTSFDNDGTLSTGTQSAFQTAANALPGGGNPLHVWGKTSGSNAPVIAASVPDKAVVLRSRRD